MHSPSRTIVSSIPSGLVLKMIERRCSTFAHGVQRALTVWWLRLQARVIIRPGPTSRTSDVSLPSPCSPLRSVSNPHISTSDAGNSSKICAGTSTSLASLAGIRQQYASGRYLIPDRHFLILLLFLNFGCCFSGIARTTVQATLANTIGQPRIALNKVRLPLMDRADIRFRRFTSTDDPAKSNAGPFVQDDQGFIWFGTPYGLNRFDGFNYKVFTHDPANPKSISGSYVNALFKDHRGSIWIGCNQSLNELDSQTETFKKFNIPLVVNISQDTTGTMWLSTTTGLYALDPATGSVRRYFHDPDDPASLDSSDIKSSGEDRNGDFWVATSEGFDAFDRHSGKVTLRIPIQETSHPFSFYEDHFGILWIYHVSGDPLATFDRKTNTLTEFSFQEKGSPRRALTGITGIAEDHDGELWLSTNGAGVMRFDRRNRRFIRYRHNPTDSESIAQDSINHMFVDREGIFWLSLGAFGPTRFTTEPLPFKRYRRDFGDSRIQDQLLFVGAIYEDHHGILWIGTHDGLHRIDRVREQYRTYQLTGHGEGSDVISINEDHSGNLWVGTYSHGLFRFNTRTGRIRRFQHIPGNSHSLSSDVVPRVLVSHGGTIWAATYDGLDRYDEVGHGFTTYRAPSQGVPPHYLELVEAPDSMMWLGTESSGLERFDPATGGFTTYQYEPGRPASLGSNRVNSVHFDRYGSMWVGTQEGVDHFDQQNASFTHYTQKNGLPGVAVGCVLEDGRGHLWMSTDNGVATLDPLTKTTRSYTIADGLPGPDLTGWGACLKSSTGEMFFGGFSGATAFFPDRLSESSSMPLTALTDFKVLGISLSPGPGSPLRKTISYIDEITLSHKQTVFSIGFSTLSYLNPSTNRYRYMLEGLDQGWVEVGSDQRFATYTTLPPGSYTFHVEGATGRGLWGEPGAILRIVILPAWWNSWWFRTIYIAALLLIAWGVYSLHLRQIDLEHNIRLEERLSERIRISRELHDTLLQSFQGLSLRFQAVMQTLPDDSITRGLVEDVLDTADQILLEGRRSVRELRDDPLPDGDLVDGLVQCGEALGQEHLPHFSVAVIGVPRPLTPTILNEAYRIAREAIINAFHHSRANKIEVEIAYYDRNMRIIIRDDGIGIDEKILNEGRPDHWGLSGMRERARRIGSVFKLWSRQGAGTEVELTIAAHVAYRPELRKSIWRRLRFTMKGTEKYSDQS